MAFAGAKKPDNLGRHTMLERIKASLPFLAPAAQPVGKLVLTDPRVFAKLPVTELAHRAHVSKPTVVRFCRSIGYDGLSDFKLKLAGSVSEGVPFIHRSVDVDDKTSDVAVKVIDNTAALRIGERLQPLLCEMKNNLRSKRYT
jgi:RpiR family carbohydrate utilization transcriptional regulator